MNSGPFAMIAQATQQQRPPGPPGGPPQPPSDPPGQGGQPMNPANYDFGDFTQGNPIKNRDILYRLIISQLFYDGYTQIAVQLTNLLAADPPCPPSDRLYAVVTLGLAKEIDAKHRPQNLPEQLLGHGLDLEYETDIPVTAPEPALYETAYVTSHKNFCRAGAFSADGTLCATGSADASIKILDVGRMLAKSSLEGVASQKAIEQGGHPVIRTLYDHVDEVTCLEFHPKDSVLASGSRDLTIKLYDYSKASAKKAMRTIQEADVINSISFHPTGDYLLAGCDQPIVRMYDVNTSQCFVGVNPRHQHTAKVTCVKWSPDGKLYATCSTDGSIKIWDGVSSQCVATFLDAHDSNEVCSVQFTRNGKYVLSSGKDSLVKLWELSTARCLIAYTGAGATGKQEYRVQATFNQTEDYVMFPDEQTVSLCCWDSRNASRKQLLSLGHNGVVRHMVHSPTQAAFLTCSDDFRARFWYKKIT